MYSTFHGLETARRGMFTQQAALHTTGHNISNANTEGYTRQRVNFSQTEPYPNAARNAPRVPGQMGTGVEADFIQRIREGYLDNQYRGENATASYWQTKHDSLERIEDLMNEPSDSGLSNSMDEFWNALQDLSVNPEDSGARSVVRQRGTALAETFNHIADSLETNQQDLKQQIETNQSEVNSILSRINDLNEQISRVEPHGQMPNDLYDERDRLLDELSGMVNIEVDNLEPTGHAEDAAEGTVDVYLLDDNGDRMEDENGDDLKLIEGGEDKDFRQFDISVNEEDGKHEFVDDTSMYWDSEGEGESIEMDLENSPGKMKALLEDFGIGEAGDYQGTYPDLMNDLDTMVETFASEFNDVHREGWSLNDINGGRTEGGVPFFSFDNGDGESAAASLQVSQEIKNDLDNIAASSPNKAMLNFESGDESVPGPMLSGEYEGDSIDLQVRVDDSGAWEYSEDGGTSWDGITGDSVTIDGLTISVPENVNPGEETTWSAEEEITEGYSPEAFAGDGSNALALANVKDEDLDFGGDSTTNVQSYYQGIIGQMAVDTAEAEQKAENTGSLRDSVDSRRMEVSSVSLDEEMSNMIQFQHAYNAAARNITAVDEMLDRIINNMGLVGR
ncbi:flagellar hook-associated protein FlgK [Salibacterium aidingense]|uniref:flagellar hook-associated protein FlgK n=1 Tax=Salibacterium aidingense TaxID=384933 RepID=UPI0004076306|nr:flagellar hook-associated protein FlgK [Salibacterium aidingense]